MWLLLLFCVCVCVLREGEGGCWLVFLSSNLDFHPVLVRFFVVVVVVCWCYSSSKNPEVHQILGEKVACATVSHTRTRTVMT